MRNTRKHKRFRLNVLDLSSKMSMVGAVDIVNISAGGVAIKSDRKLNIGKECLLMLKHEGKNISIKGVIVRSELSEIMERPNGDHVTIYSAGIMFRDDSAGSVKKFLDSVEQDEKMQVLDKAGWFYRDILFCITTPDEQVLNLLAQFTIREISPRGVIIRTNHYLNPDSVVLLELALFNSPPVSFMGRVISSREARDNASLPAFDIGVEFSELTDYARDILARFIECMSGK
ncbi:MAG TPA: PilZ domain-containing protein [Nitrospirota bacterium]|nr:PilZ domain-containing protein [Nitrospirota bacterium]